MWVQIRMLLELLKFRRVTTRRAQPSLSLSEEVCMSEGFLWEEEKPVLKRPARAPKGSPEFCRTWKVLQNVSHSNKLVEERFCRNSKELFRPCKFFPILEASARVFLRGSFCKGPRDFPGARGYELVWLLASRRACAMGEGFVSRQWSKSTSTALWCMSGFAAGCDLTLRSRLSLPLQDPRTLELILKPQET